MMYLQKMAVSVKCGGKVMREQGETVYLPFGSEYSLYFKNLASQRAVVKVEIDGENVTEGGIIVNANDSVDLERFILDGNLDDGPRFKFIEKTEQISDHRGDRTEDGIIRVSYQYEKPYSGYINTITNVYRDPWNTPLGGAGGNQVYGSPLRGMSDGTDYGTMEVGCSVDGLSADNTTITTQSFNDAGITAKGSKSEQKFKHGYVSALEDTEHVIVFQLKGKKDEVEVVQPLTVKTKVKCELCGTKNKSTNKFCKECGNNLTY